MNYRMTIYPAIEACHNKIVFEFETPEQMISAKNTSAELLLFLQDDIKVMDDYSNVFVLEEKISEEWEEYEEFEL